MDLKKIIIAIIILLIVVIGAFFIISTQANQEIKYDDNFKISVPADFQNSKSNGSVSSVYPSNNSYVITLAEDGAMNTDNVESYFNVIQAAASNPDGKQNFTDVKKYDVGNNKVYEYTTMDTEVIKIDGHDAKKMRLLNIVVPNSTKVYDMFILTNDTSLDLHNTEIEAIVNSTSTSE